MFIYIKQYFEMGLYTVDDLSTFKMAAMITADQFDELTTTTTEVAQ
ncbi:XkdX family protein [Lactiplantibacillus nangangensis]|uniref:XkdX family protein n=1 Tax=Lactiplantibacillus nangangensis TaxID=2559917 RepID=A0ABW1SMF2_9LACO|nr:XkdX family protein [Lactiplantibacillus nangangensis]